MLIKELESIYIYLICLYEKNGFAKISKNLARSENNFVRPSKIITYVGRFSC